MEFKIERHFVTLNGKWGRRQVHYRRSGSGPTVLLLHQSPQSSRELIPLIRQWAQHFTVVAPDSPGYGLSDPLGIDEANLDDFASASIEFMDAIGSAKFGVYGFHTGGMIGIALAVNYPDRVNAMACNGVVIPTEAELEEIRKLYLPQFEPRWDGRHLAWLWGRIREQTIFFPWHNRSVAGRMDFPMPSPEHQQNSVLEFLRSGDHYRIAYRAAFEFRADEVVARLEVPSLITAADWDPLQPHLRRVRHYPDNPSVVRIIESSTAQDALAVCLELLRQNPGDEIPTAAQTKGIPGELWQQIVRTRNGEFIMRSAGKESAKSVLLLHDAGQSSAKMAMLAKHLSQSHHVIAIDLPGHGETDFSTTIAGLDVRACAAAVLECCEARELNNVAVIGDGAGALIALELTNLQPQLVRRCLLLNLIEFSDEQSRAWRELGLPSLAPEWSGGHLLKCWHMSRDSRLYFPWFKRDQRGIIWHEPQLDDESIQMEVSDFLKSEGHWQALMAARLDYPIRKVLMEVAIPVVCCAAKQSSWFPAARELANRVGLPFAELPDQAEERANSLSRLLSEGVDK